MVAKRNVYYSFSPTAIDASAQWKKVCGQTQYKIMWHSFFSKVCGFQLAKFVQKTEVQIHSTSAKQRNTCRSEVTQDKPCCWLLIIARTQNLLCTNDDVHHSTKRSQQTWMCRHWTKDTIILRHKQGWKRTNKQINKHTQTRTNTHKHAHSISTQTSRHTTSQNRYMDLTPCTKIIHYQDSWKFVQASHAYWFWLLQHTGLTLNIESCQQPSACRAPVHVSMLSHDCMDDESSSVGSHQSREAQQTIFKCASDIRATI